MVKNIVINKLKKDAPQLIRDIGANIERLVDSVAEENGIPPFKLHFLIKKDEEITKGYVIKGEEKISYTDMTKLINSIFENALKAYPKMLTDFIMGFMDGRSIDVVIGELLEKGSLVYRYNEDDELIAYTLDHKTNKEEPVDWSDFINSIGDGW